MSARLAGCAALVLLASAASAAEPAAMITPALRTVNTPAGLMLERVIPSAPVSTATEPATEVQSSPNGPMLVLRQPTDRTNSASAARTTAAPTLPAGVRAEAMPNGAQMLVMPSHQAPAAAAITAPAIVDIDRAKPGTRMGDPPRNGVLYRPKAAAVEPSAAR